MSQATPTVEEMKGILSGKAPVAQGSCQEKTPGGTVNQIANEVSSLQKKVEMIRSGKRLTPKEIREGIDLLFQKYDFSPVEELICMAMTAEKEETKVRICMFLTEFMLPKLKSIEVSGSVDHNHSVVIRRFGKDGMQIDTPLQRVPGLPAPEKVISSLSRSTEEIINSEVIK